MKTDITALSACIHEAPMLNSNRSAKYSFMAKVPEKKYSIERNYQAVGAFLREKREAAGLTQIEVSKVLGYNSSQLISNFEAGIAVPPLKKLALLVELYKMKPNELLDVIQKAEREVMLQALVQKKQLKRAR